MPVLVSVLWVNTVYRIGNEMGLPKNLESAFNGTDHHTLFKISLQARI